MLLNETEAFIDKHKLLAPGDAVIVGYSGGADSACLLHLLTELGYSVTAAHLHHGMRTEAEAESEQCRLIAESLGIGFLLGHADVPALSQAAKMSMEEAGRHARYEFFRQCAAGSDGAKVATGHTLNDHVETMLINIARGSGMAGVSGIPVARDNIVRPLLWATREQTRAYCFERNIWFHDDPANFEKANARTAIREMAIPALQVVNPKALDNAARMAELLHSESALLDSMAAAMLEACERRLDHPLGFLVESVEAVFDKGKLAHYPPPLQRRGIRLAGLLLGASFEFDHVDACIAALSTDSFSVTAGGGLVVAEVDRDVLRLRSVSQVEPFREVLTIPGETISDEMNWLLAAWEPTSPFEPAGKLEGQLDPRKTKGALFVRPFQAGDRLEIPGHKASKLQDLFAEQKVGAAMKSRLPIVCDMIGPVWAPMVGTDARVAVVEPEGRRLALRFGPISTE